MMVRPMELCVSWALDVVTQQHSFALLTVTFTAIMLSYMFIKEE